jgi:hypothetical protein
MATKRGRRFWTRIIEEFEGSQAGETHEEFSARHGIEKTTFQRWLYALRNEHRRRTPPVVRLLPVRVEGMEAEHALSVDLGGGLGLRVQVGTDPSYVAALVAALRPC